MKHPNVFRTGAAEFLRDFVFEKNDIVVTPAGLRSGWRWFGKSDVIVVTLEPNKVEKFALNELGIVLTSQQLADQPLFRDADLCAAGVMLRDALENDDLTSGVMFEAMSRVFLVKLLQKYGQQQANDLNLSLRFTSQHYQRVLTFIQQNLERTISVEDLAREAATFRRLSYRVATRRQSFSLLPIAARLVFWDV